VYNLVTTVFGGTISVDAADEVGAGFTVRLPRVSPKSDV